METQRSKVAIAISLQALKCGRVAVFGKAAK
jgi:hypothetical protein